MGGFTGHPHTGGNAMDFVYTTGDGNHYRVSNGVRLIASGHLTTKHYDDDQSPQQDRINYDCALCEAGELHTEWRHEELINPE